jgi:hypothetical protein
MTFKTALRARIKENATVLAQSARVDWSARPQATQFPAIVLDMISGQGDQHFLGEIGTQGNRIQATILAKTQAQAELLRSAVQGVLMSGGVSDGVTFQRGFVNLFRDGVDSTETDVIFREILDVTVWYN